MPSGPVLWSGTVALPAARVSGQFRILIEEIETYRGLHPIGVVSAETVVL